MTLSPNTTYYYRVRAVNSDGESDYSNTVQVTTTNEVDSTTPSSDASLPILYKTFIDTRSALIVFAKPSSLENILEYKVTVSVNSDYSSPLYSNFIYQYGLETVDMYGGDYIGFNIIGLAANTTYYIRITAVNSISTSSNLTFNIKTRSVLSAPQAIGTTNLSAIGARLNWLPVKTATSYRVDVSTSSSFNTFVVNNANAGSNLYYDVSSLTENTLYYYRVRAVGATTSDSSDTCTFTTLDDIEEFNSLSTYVPAPSVLNIYNKSNTSFSFLLNENPGCVYTVQYSLSDTFGSIIATLTSQNTDFVLSNLTANTVYHVRIKAAKNNFDSEYTIFNTKTLLVNNSLNTVTSLAAINVQSTSFIAAWTKQSFATNYILQLSTSNTFSSILKTIYTDNVDTVLIEDLTPGTSYYYRVFGINSLNITTAGNTITVNTLAQLDNITAPTVTEITKNSAKININTSADYEKYLLTVYKTNEGKEQKSIPFFDRKDIGFVSSYLIDVFLTAGTNYSAYVTGVTENGEEIISGTVSFTTKYVAPIISFGQNSGQLAVYGTANKLDIATDKQFVFTLPGYSGKTISTSSSTNVPVSASDYYIRVYYEDNAGVRSDYSNTLFKSKIIPVYYEPVITNTTAEVSWNNTEASFYLIKLLYNNSGTFVPVAGYTNYKNTGKDASVIFENLTPDLEYKLLLRVYDPNVNKIIQGYTLDFKTLKYANDLTGLSLDGGLTVENNNVYTINEITNDSFKLFIAGNYNLYKLALSRHPDFMYIEKYIELDNGSFVYFNDLKPDTNYYLKIWPIVEADNEYASPNTLSTSTLPVTVPNAVSTSPTILSTTVDGLQAEIVHSAVNNALGYKLQISRNNLFNILDKSVNIKYMPGNKIRLSNLLPGTTYYVRIYAYSSNISPYSPTGTISL